ncbi:MAG TPA: ATP-binding cassette domain-containing protein, partial [Saprospiraceae bacterium]|nr:ATP-binding cassette domain-containing protein [Saprospiraceae bacterium]
MIEINSLSKSFGKLDVLKNVKLTLNPNQSVALIGPNGCGKTTLIKSILGMVLPDSGEIKFDGHKIRNQFQYRNEIGYMPQIGHYPENMTIGHIIEIMKEIRNSSKELDEDLLHAFKLKNMFDKKMRTLSGGT